MSEDYQKAEFFRLAAEAEENLKGYNPLIEDEAIVWAMNAITSEINHSHNVSDDLNAALALIADIRKAAGDEMGRLMQDELVRHIVGLKAARQWTAIDYANHETFPDENRNCIVAWTWGDGTHPDRAAMYQFNDCGDCMMLWVNAVTGDVMDWDGIGKNPTHWMYAPNFKEAT